MQTWPTRTRQTCTWDRPQRSGACNRTRRRWRLAVHRGRWPPGRRSRQAAWQGRKTTEVSGNHGVIGSHQEAIKSHQQVISRSSGGHQEVIRRSSAGHQQVISRSSAGHHLLGRADREQSLWIAYGPNLRRHLPLPMHRRYIDVTTAVIGGMGRHLRRTIAPSLRRLEHAISRDLPQRCG